MLALSRKHSLSLALVMALASINLTKPQTQLSNITKLTPQYYNQPPEPQQPPEQPKQPDNDKNWWVRSKTVWFNVGVTALGVAGALFPVADMVLPYFKPFLSPHVYAVAMAVIGAGNVVLRAKTQTKLTAPAQSDTPLDDVRDPSQTITVNQDE